MEERFKKIFDEICELMEANRYHTESEIAKDFEFYHNDLFEGEGEETLALLNEELDNIRPSADCNSRCFDFSAEKEIDDLIDEVITFCSDVKAEKEKADVSNIKTRQDIVNYLNKNVTGLCTKRKNFWFLKTDIQEKINELVAKIPNYTFFARHTGKRDNVLEFAICIGNISNYTTIVVVRAFRKDYEEWVEEKYTLSGCYTLHGNDEVRTRKVKEEGYQVSKVDFVANWYEKNEKQESIETLYAKDMANKKALQERIDKQADEALALLKEKGFESIEDFASLLNEVVPKLTSEQKTELGKKIEYSAEVKHRW